MILCAVGDVHGAINQMYADVLAFEARLGVRFDWVLQVGDFGVWPDPSRVDKPTRKHKSEGDFAQLLAHGTTMPRPTLFIKGNHEDFDWLDAQPDIEVLPGLYYHRNGYATCVRSPQEMLIVGGIGGCYSHSDYTKGRQKRHYTVRDVAKQFLSPCDILLTHEAPAGVPICGGERLSNTSGLDEVIAARSPKVCFFGHYHERIRGEVHGVPCYGLNKIGKPGNLLAFDVTTRGVTTLGAVCIGESI